MEQVPPVPLEMRDFVDKIDSPYVGVYFDVGNVVSTGYRNTGSRSGQEDQRYTSRILESA